jgi:predicted TIM-barrel fold metal-dependent hydrolase
MGAINQPDRVTRRAFLEFSSVALATAGLLGDGSAAQAAEGASTVDTIQSGSTSMARKIALEEHFVLPENVDTTYAIRDLPTPELRQKVLDVGGGRIAEMDRGGVEISILSHAAVGAQAILEVAQAIAFSTRANDYLAEHIAKYPKRLKGFAALPMQDPEIAAQELTRCV